MWKPYLKVIAKKARQAIHILGRFHIVCHMNKAIDKVRAAEAKELERNRESRTFFRPDAQLRPNYRGSHQNTYAT